MLAGMLTAVRLLTVVPVGRTEGGQALRYFPLVGWLFAGVSVALAWAADAIGAASGNSALVAAVAIVAANGLLSGLLHWDGLADCADGFGVRGDRDQRLRVMRDSTIGAFGVTAIVFVAAAQIAATAAVVESGSWWALAAAPVLGRLGASFALGLRAPARPEGLGARYARRISAVGLVALLVPVVPLIGWDFSARVVLGAATFAGVLVAFFTPAPFVRRFGGVTGDVLGATILLTETAILALGALVGGPL